MRLLGCKSLQVCEALSVCFDYPGWLTTVTGTLTSVAAKQSNSEISADIRSRNLVVIDNIEVLLLMSD